MHKRSRGPTKQVQSFEFSHSLRDQGFANGQTVYMPGPTPITTATFDKGAICTGISIDVNLQLLFWLLKPYRERRTECASLCRDAVCNVHARAAGLNQALLLRVLQVRLLIHFLYTLITQTASKPSTVSCAYI